MYGGFDLNSYCDNLDDDYGIFDDVADNLNFESVGISTAKPAADLDGDCPHNSYAWQEKKVVEVAIAAPKTAKGKRGRKPGQKPRCGACGTLGHTRRTCGS
jgi:hypothetical protein